MNKLETVVIFSILSIARVVTFLAFPIPLQYPDSPGYFSGRFLDFSQISLIGNSSRGWPVPLLFAFAPSSTFVTLFQIVISNVAWTLLIYSGSNYLQSKVSKYFFAGVTVAVASSAAILQWDTVVLGTSVMLSTVISLVALIFLLNNTAHPRKIAFAIGFLNLLLGLQKMSNIFLVTSIFLILILWIRKNQSFKMVITYSLISLVSLSYILFTGTNVDRHWDASYSGTTLLWQLGEQSPSAISFKQYLAMDKRAPECILVEAPYVNLDASVRKIFDSCPEGVTFVREDIQKAYFNFLLSHPNSMIHQTIQGFGAYYSNSANNYGNAIQLIPTSLTNLFSGGTSPSLLNGNITNQGEGYAFITSGNPFWIYAPGAGILLMALLIIICNFLVKSRKSTGTHVVLIHLALLSQAMASNLLLPSEWVRQLTPYLVPLFIVNAMVLIQNILDSRTLREV